MKPHIRLHVTDVGYWFAEVHSRKRVAQWAGDRIGRTWNFRTCAEVMDALRNDCPFIR